jgi:hypothetical protein
VSRGAELEFAYLGPIAVYRENVENAAGKRENLHRKHRKLSCKITNHTTLQRSLPLYPSTTNDPLQSPLGYLLCIEGFPNARSYLQNFEEEIEAIDDEEKRLRSELAGVRDRLDQVLLPLLAMCRRHSPAVDHFSSRWARDDPLHWFLPTYTQAYRLISKRCMTSVCKLVPTTKYSRTSISRRQKKSRSHNKVLSNFDKREERNSVKLPLKKNLISLNVAHRACEMSQNAQKFSLV